MRKPAVEKPQPERDRNRDQQLPDFFHPYVPLFKPKLQHRGDRHARSESAENREKRFFIAPGSKIRFQANAQNQRDQAQPDRNRKPHDAFPEPVKESPKCVRLARGRLFFGRIDLQNRWLFHVALLLLLRF